MAGERWKRRDAAVKAANTVLVPLASAVRFAWERLGTGARYRLEAATSDYRVYVAVVELPGSRPLVLGLYATTEESRPITFHRLRPRLERLRKLVARYAPPGCDTLLFIVATARARPTRPAKRVLARLRVGFMSPRELRGWLHKYILRRLTRLLDTLREKKTKAWGPLAGLLRTLYALAKELGPLPISLAEVDAAIRA